MSSLLQAAICFLACHAGPAEHFATFAQEISNDGKQVEIYASGPAKAKFESRGVAVMRPFDLDRMTDQEQTLLAEQIAKECATSSAIITDVGHPFGIKVHAALKRFAPHARRFTYYDNPEPYVPGGYSSVASRVMKASECPILFANANLACEIIYQEPGKAIDFGNQDRIGIGYYPIEAAEKIAQRRAVEQTAKRQEFFVRHRIKDERQKVLVYFGGNNTEYFEKAFPAFLSLLEQADLSHYVVVFQQHPSAKAQNLDLSMVESWMQQNRTAAAPRVVVSDINSDEAQIIADVAMYYQTSMGPQFVLAGIPTIQVGHETFEDLLVKRDLCASVTDVEHLLKALHQLRVDIDPDIIYQGLGIKPDWLQRLKLMLERTG